MWELNKKIIVGLFSVLILGTLPSLVNAGGAFSTTKEGDPVLWQDGQVFYRLDPGGSEDADLGGGDAGGGGKGCMLIPEANASVIKSLNVADMVRHGFQQWKDNAPGLVLTEGPALPENVTFANAENFYVGTFVVEPFVSTVTADPCYSGDTANCLNSVIFDPHGLITDGILGKCARFSVFGFASILPKVLDDEAGTITTKNLKAAQMVVNGTCVTPVDPGDNSCGASQFGFTECPLELDQKGLQGVVTHELGHFLGLDHVLVEKVLYSKCSKENAGCTAQELEKIPTMIGLAVPGADLDTLTQDDKSTIRGFYPGSEPECSITGVVTSGPDNNGRCFEVFAQKSDNPDFIVGTVSGAYAPRNSQGISCDITNPDGSQDVATYHECLNSPNAAQTLKVHTNCTLAPGSCGEFEIKGLESGTYHVGVQSFKFEDIGDSIPFVLEPCTQVRNENLVSDIKVINNAVTITCPGTFPVPLVLDFE